MHQVPINRLFELVLDAVPVAASFVALLPMPRSDG
jgi:hypothetical protein